MNGTRALVPLALAALLAPAVACASGYAIYEQGATALGVAGAYTASAHDGSALFYNPAALASLRGFEITGGGSWLATRQSFAGSDVGANSYPGYNVRESMVHGNFFLPHLYLNSPLTHRSSIGVGVYTPYGLGTEWEDPTRFTGREHATKARLETVNLGASIAYAITDRLSLAAGVNELWGSVELHQIRLSPPLPGSGGGRANVADVKLESAMRTGTGFNGALLWAPAYEWSFGLAYRGGIDVKIDDGDATFTQIPTGNPSVDAGVAASLPPNQKVGTTLHFPAILSVGAAWRPLPQWTWEADVNWTQWSDFDRLALDFKTTNSADTSLVEDYHDSYRVSVGAERRGRRFTYRLGYYYDQDAAPAESVTPLLPDASRHGATLGLGFKLGAKKNIAVDLYNLALFVETRSTEGISRDHYDGVYKAYVNSTGLTIGYHW